MKSKIILFLLFSMPLNAQLAKPFFGLGWGINTEFENKGFGNISSGVEFNFLKYVKPEIEIGFFFGRAQQNSKLDGQYNVTNLLDKDFTALNFSFSPKIVWEQEEDSNAFIQIMPKYSIARVEAIGNYYNVSLRDNTITFAERQVLKGIKQTFGIGIGICVGVSEKSTDAIALNLYYNNNDFGGLINELKYNSGQNDTKNVLSFGVNYYFGKKKKE
jgi:predicted porin